MIFFMRFSLIFISSNENVCSSTYEFKAVQLAYSNMLIQIHETTDKVFIDFDFVLLSGKS